MRDEDLDEWVRFGMSHTDGRNDEQRPAPRSDASGFAYDLAIILAGFFAVVILLRTLVTLAGS